MHAQYKAAAGVQLHPQFLLNPAHLLSSKEKNPITLRVPTVPAGLSSVIPHSCRTSTPLLSKNSMMRLQAAGGMI
jgi:hypothetical protein